MPPFHVLYLVQKQIIKIAINLVKHFKNVVQLTCINANKTLIIKISVGIPYPCAFECLIAKC